MSEAWKFLFDNKDSIAFQRIFVFDFLSAQSTQTSISKEVGLGPMQ